MNMPEAKQILSRISGSAQLLHFATSKVCSRTSQDRLTETGGPHPTGHTYKHGIHAMHVSSTPDSQAHTHRAPRARSHRQCPSPSINFLAQPMSLPSHHQPPPPPPARASYAPHGTPQPESRTAYHTRRQVRVHASRKSRQLPTTPTTERVRGVAGAREAVGGFARGEAVEADELQEETCVASRSRSVAVRRDGRDCGCDRARARRLVRGCRLRARRPSRCGALACDGGPFALRASHRGCPCSRTGQGWTPRASSSAARSGGYCETSRTIVQMSWSVDQAATENRNMSVAVRSQTDVGRRQAER
jgi:hypothetical protein